MDLSDLSDRELWLRYFALGGTASPGSVITHVASGAILDEHQHNVIVHALNERFHELGLGRPVPYVADLA